MFMLRDLLLVTDCHILGLMGKRKDLLERQKRLGRVFTDGVIDESEYQLQRHRIAAQFESLTDPAMGIAKEAGLLKIFRNSGKEQIWRKSIAWSG